MPIPACKAGRALAISASLLDPAVIVLGGNFAAAATCQPLITAMRESFQSISAHRTPQPIRFEISVLGGDATVIGAAEWVLSELLA